MEHLKKYWWIYLLLAIGIVAVWYFFIRKPSDNKSDEPKKLSEGPSIYDAKKELEDKIMPNDYVTSIGTRHIDSKSFIQVGVTKEEYKENIKSLLDDGKWKGFPVDVVIEEKSAAKVYKKPTKQKWSFKTVIETPNNKQKRLAVDLNSGDQKVPDEFKAGQNIKLHIHQTPDFVYDISGKIISIDSNRDSMLVEFVGKTTDKAYGDVEIK